MPALARSSKQPLQAGKRYCSGWSCPIFCHVGSGTASFGSLVAWALFAVGEQDEGMSLLERIQPRGASLWFWLRSPGFDRVRSLPRFRQIVEESRR